MVDCQPALRDVHGARMDQPIRRPLQSQLSEEPDCDRLQPRRSCLHYVPRSDLVLPPRRGRASQDRQEQDQALAGINPQPHTPSDSLIPGDLAGCLEMKMETHKVAKLHAILWGIFSLGGMIAA